jgi:hypothetical protein
MTKRTFIHKLRLGFDIEVLARERPDVTPNLGRKTLAASARSGPGTRPFLLTVHKKLISLGQGSTNSAVNVLGVPLRGSVALLAVAFRFSSSLRRCLRPALGRIRTNQGW